jgi:hypothetical protein
MLTVHKTKVHLKIREVYNAIVKGPKPVPGAVFILKRTEDQLRNIDPLKLQETLVFLDKQEEKEGRVLYLPKHVHRMSCVDKLNRWMESKDVLSVVPPRPMSFGDDVFRPLLKLKMLSAQQLRAGTIDTWDTWGEGDELWLYEVFQSKVDGLVRELKFYRPGYTYVYNAPVMLLQRPRTKYVMSLLDVFLTGGWLHDGFRRVQLSPEAEDALHAYLKHVEGSMEENRIAYGCRLHPAWRTRSSKEIRHAFASNIPPMFLPE